MGTWDMCPAMAQPWLCHGPAGAAMAVSPPLTGHESHHGIYPASWLNCDSVMAWPITTQIGYEYARSQK